MNLYALTYRRICTLDAYFVGVTQTCYFYAVLSLQSTHVLSRK